MIVDVVSIAVFRWVITTYVSWSCAFGTWMPLSIPFAEPIPTPPWVTERMEEKYVAPKDR